MDYAGPFLGSMFLVIVDAHSKLIEVYNTEQASTDLTEVSHFLACKTFDFFEPAFTRNVS